MCSVAVFGGIVLVSDRIRSGLGCFGAVWGGLGRFGVVWGGLGWFGVIQWTPIEVSILPF